MNIKDWLVRLMKSSPQYYAYNDNRKQELLLLDTPLYEKADNVFVFENMNVDNTKPTINLDYNDDLIRHYIPQPLAYAKTSENTVVEKQEKLAV